MEYVLIILGIVLIIFGVNSNFSSVMGVLKA